MRFSKSLPVRKWITRERLALFVASVVTNAFIGLSALFADDFPRTPDKWLVGSLTIVTAPIIFVLIFDLLIGWLDKSGGEWLEKYSSFFGFMVAILLVGIDAVVFILLSDLWQRLGVLDYGAAWTSGSVVLSDVAALIAIYEFVRHRNRK